MDANKSLQSKPGPKNIPIELMIHYIDQEGLSITDCAKKLGINKTSVSSRLKRHGYVPGYLKNYDNAEISMLKQIRSGILNKIASYDHKKTSFSQLTTAYGILTDKQLILEGKPNQIVAHADLVKAKELEEKRIREFEKRFGDAISINSKADN